MGKKLILGWDGQDGCTSPNGTPPISYIEMPRICAGTLKSGAPCTFHAKLGKRFCARHQPIENIPEIVAPVDVPVVVVANNAAAVVGPVVVANNAAAVVAPPVTVRVRRLADPVHMGDRRVAPAIHEVVHEAALIAMEMGIFVADAPDGAINIAGFVNDSQNVHRTSTVTATSRCIATLLTRPVTATSLESLMDTFETTCYEKGVLRRRTEAAFKVLSTFERDCELTAAFDTPYVEVARRVLAFIGTNPDPLKALVSEIEGGMGMCSQGKMCRLINSIRGFDPEMEDAPDMSVFQTQFARLMDLPASERRIGAQALFVEYRMAEEAQAAWLEALEE